MVKNIVKNQKRKWVEIRLTQKMGCMGNIIQKKLKKELVKTF